MVNQNGGQRQSTSEGVRLHVEHEYISQQREIYRDQKASVQTDEESNIFDIQTGSKQGDTMSSLLFTTVLQYSLKDETKRWQKKKGMEIYLSDHDRDCLTNLRFVDDVMLFATSKEQIWKMMCELKKATEKVGLTIHPDKTKILTNQCTINSDTKKHIEVDDMSIEILTRNESVKIFGPENLVLPTRDNRNQELDQGSLGDLPQIQTRVDIEKTTCSNIVYGFSTPQFLRLFATQREHGHQTKNTKNDSIDATQDATTHYPDKKDIQKIEKTRY